MDKFNQIKKIFCILGLTASGKDSITTEVSKQLNIPILVSHTSRPMRTGEIKDQTYHYVDNDFFDKNTFLEHREYNTEYGIWKYGLHENELKDKPYSLFIVDSIGYNELANKLGKDKLISIFIEVDENILRERHSKRGDCEKEFTRRIQDDIRRFKGFISDYIIYNNESLEKSVQSVKDIIIEEIMEDCI